LPCALQKQFTCHAAGDFFFGSRREPSGFLRKALLEARFVLTALSTLSHGGLPLRYAPAEIQKPDFAVVCPVSDGSGE
jgi:hypothetical protein